MANLGEYYAPLEPNQTSRVYDISLDTSILSTFTPHLYNLSVANQTEADDVRFQWDEKDYTKDYTLINYGPGYNTSATVLIVDDSDIFTIMDIVTNLRTGENMQVTNKSTGSPLTITVIRGVGNAGTGVAILNNDPLLIIGNASQEASRSPDANNANTTTVYNYCQITRKSFSISGTLIRTRGTPGEDFAASMADCMEETLREIEYTLLFGKIDLNQAAFTKERYTSRGIKNYITTNVEPVGGTLSQAAWRTFLNEKAFAYGANTKIFLCGHKYLECFTKWAETGANYLYQPGTANVGIAQGISVGVYTAPGGQQLIIASHELFRKDALLQGLGIVIDPTQIKFRYTGNVGGTIPEGFLFPDGKLKMVQHMQENDRDGYKYDFFAQYGLECRNESRHAMMTGVTGPA